jgi:hypothetical protein
MAAGVAFPVCDTAIPKKDSTSRGKFLSRPGALPESLEGGRSSHEQRRKKMIIGEVLGFWLVVGVAFFGWRRLKSDKESSMPHVLPRADGRRA